jgi:hypothetical protein
MSRSMGDLEESSSHWVYEQDQDCVCCSLPKWRTSWDLSFIDKQWTSSFEELGDATKNGCQNCGVILDAVSTYIAPETYLPGTKIAVEPCPEEGRLRIDIKPWQDSKDMYVELEVLHSLGTCAVHNHRVLVVSNVGCRENTHRLQAYFQNWPSPNNGRS